MASSDEGSRGGVGQEMRMIMIHGDGDDGDDADDDDGGAMRTTP